MRVTAPAKINLHLRVGPPTADGFHPLVSWMTTVGLFDILDFTRVDDSSAPSGVRLRCDDPSVPTDASNLVVKTATALLDSLDASHNPDDGGGRSASDAPRRSFEARSFEAALQKRIPVGAGLGGGSSDGAFALVALDRLLGLNWPAGRLANLAARFGSDLAFFLHGSSSICTGRGEVVSPTPRPRSRAVLLILPAIHMSTPAVYRRFDEMKLGDPTTIASQPDWLAWAALSARELLPLLVNDLEAPAFSIRPELGELRVEAERALGRVVRMSGSGSSLFTLYDEMDEAARAAEVELSGGVRRVAVELCPAS
jgi:4-diphosphocytidyl-2-C-methyl-D-erythritol kinase